MYVIEMKIFSVYLQVVIQHSALFRNVAFENGDTTFHMLKTIQMVKSQKHFFSTSSVEKRQEKKVLTPPFGLLMFSRSSGMVQGILWQGRRKL